MRLLQCLDPPAVLLQLKADTSLRLEFLQMLELTCQTCKALTIHPKYKAQDHGLLECLLPHLDACFRLSDAFDRRRDGSKHEASLAAAAHLLACVRNLSHSECFQETQADAVLIGLLFELLERYPLVKDLLFNALRVLSKVSTFEVFCSQVCDQKPYLDLLISLMHTYKENNFVIMRLAYILANLTAFREDVAVYIYHRDNGVIFAVFEHFMSKASKQDDYYESMVKSFAEFDFLNQEDKKVLNKLIRLMGNIFTVEEPALCFIKDKFGQYKQLLKKLRYFMNENEVQNNSELLVSVLNCISNILFYDKPNTTQNDFELANIKQDLASVVYFIMLQPKDEDILTEGLRVISNLSRSKAGVKSLLQIKLPEALQVLLKHQSRDVVYYTIGILINFSSIDKVAAAHAGLQRVQGLPRLLRLADRAARRVHHRRHRDPRRLLQSPREHHQRQPQEQRRSHRRALHATGPPAAPLRRGVRPDPLERRDQRGGRSRDPQSARHHQHGGQRLSRGGVRVQFQVVSAEVQVEGAARRAHPQATQALAEDRTLYSTLTTST